MAFITHWNSGISRVVIHRSECGHPGKHYGLKSSYKEHDTFQEAVDFAEDFVKKSPHYKVKYCQSCKPGDEPNK